MKIIIKSVFRGKECTLDASAGDTIFELKKQYAKMINERSVFFPQFNFIGEVLEDNKTLDYYLIEDGDVILSYEGPRGGGGHICPYGCGRIIPDNYKGCTELLKDLPQYFSK